MEEQDKNSLTKSARRRLRAKKLQEKYKDVADDDTSSKLSVGTLTEREDSKTPELKGVKKKRHRRRKKNLQGGETEQETSTDDVNVLLDKLSKSLGQDLTTNHKAKQSGSADQSEGGSVSTKNKKKPIKTEETQDKSVGVEDNKSTLNPVPTSCCVGVQQYPSVTVTPSTCNVSEVDKNFSLSRSALIKEANNALYYHKNRDIDDSLKSSDEDRDYSDDNDDDYNPELIDFPGLQESFAHIRKLLDAQKVLPESVESATATSTPVVHELLAKCEKVAWDVGALVKSKGKEDRITSLDDIDVSDKVKCSIASIINQRNLKNSTSESRFTCLGKANDIPEVEKEADELVTAFDSRDVAATPNGNNCTADVLPNAQEFSKFILSADEDNLRGTASSSEKENLPRHHCVEKAVLEAQKKNASPSNKMETKKAEKTKEEIKAEREAKKLAKQGKKIGKSLAPSSGDATNVKPTEQKAQQEQQQKLKENTPEGDIKQVTSTGKSKADVKAERRALQEKQRAAKASSSGQKQPETSVVSKVSSKQQQVANQQLKSSSTSSSAGKQAHRVPDDVQADNPSVEKKLARRLERQQLPQRTVAQRKVMLFSHLHQYEREVSLTRDLLINSTNLHPAIVTLGVQYAEGVVVGSNARCVALLYAMKQLVLDYETPPQKELSRDLEVQLKPAILYLKQCRPLGVSMGNAIRFLKYQLTQLTQSQEKISDSQAKRKLAKAIDDYINEKIFLADKAISITAREKINNGDVILVYGCSSLLRCILVDAHQEGKQFRVVVVDGRPRSEGKEMVRALAAIGLQCYYVLITAASYIMPEVSKVFLGAHALLANGYVMSRAGSSQVALIAREHNVPVLVCCETYKFCERVQTDSFVFNELGDPDDLVRTHLPSTPLGDWRDLKWLTLLNLTYDVTPPDLVTAVITELAVLPCTSVPVVLRVKHSESNMWEYT